MTSDRGERVQRKRVAWAHSALFADCAVATDPFAHSSHRVSLIAGRVLELASRFDTLDAHVEQIAHSLGTTRSAVEAGWNELASIGLIVSEDQIVAELRASARLAPRDPIRTLGVPCGDRAGALSQCLASYAANAQRAGRPLDLCVATNAPDESSVLSVVQAGVRMASRVAYIGRAEKCAFVEHLVTAGIERPVAEYALLDLSEFGYSVGCNRNALALYGAGERYVTVDDDTTCRLSPAPHFRDAVRFFFGEGEGYSNYVPMDFWFFDDRESCLAAAPEARDVDYLGLHDEALGHDLGALTRSRRAVELHEALDARFVHTMRTGGGAVAATFHGHAGDSAIYAPTWYMLHEGPSRDRMVQSPEAYERATVRSREIFRVAPCLTVTEGRYCATTFSGFDGTRTLAPFVPVGRYSDGVFRMVLRTCDETAFLCHLPWMGLHAPPSTRRASADDIWLTGSWLRLGEMIVQCIRSWAPSTGLGVDDTMRKLGDHLVALGSLSVEHFDDFIRARMLRQKRLYVAHYESLLDRYRGEPSYWARDVRAHIDAVVKGLATDAYVVPRDLAMSRHGAVEARHYSKDAGASREVKIVRNRVVREFGRLLRAWPDILAVTAELRSRGIRIGKYLE